MIKSKEDYKRYIKVEEENYRYSYNKFTKELESILKFVKLYRKVEYYENCKKSFVYKPIKKYLNYKFDKKSIKYGFHLPINTIDEGLCIVHTGPIYINENCKIGKYFRIHPMTTIGKNIGRNNSSPKIGDGVWVGPGARVFGDITIGDNVVIGANSVVNKSFSSNITIAGAPARIINEKGYKDYLK
ncbi:MAG: serine acetyltransferase [Bacilli bacterium]|nr:serine acetyltransferase [Bacilli bacterium]